MVGLLVVLIHEIKMGKLAGACDDSAGIPFVLGQRDGFVQGFLGLVGICLTVIGAQFDQANELIIKVVDELKTLIGLLIFLNIPTVIGIIIVIK